MPYPVLSNVSKLPTVHTFRKANFQLRPVPSDLNSIDEILNVEHDIFKEL